MKVLVAGLLLLFVYSSFVFAAASEVEASFGVGSSSRVVANYVPPENSFGDYWVYFVLVFIALAFVYFVLKQKKVSKKKVSRKKVVAKKSARKKVAKK